MSKNLKLKKVNKNFVPEPKESQVFRVFLDSYAYELCERFPYPDEYVYFTYLAM